MTYSPLVNKTCNLIFDTTFDVSTDSNGKDPDSYSKTLKSYHRLLWSKELPNGNKLILDNELKNTSDAGCFSFGSDSITHTYSRWKRYQSIIKQVDSMEIEHFLYIANTVGAYTIFPNNTISGVQTINRARGINRNINDRFDLTLECIRRYYNNEESPLYKELKAYTDFFALFENFKGYVDYFFFQDLVSSDYEKINYFHPFSNFGDNTLPETVEEYLSYKERSVAFVLKRNNRMKEWVENNLNLKLNESLDIKSKNT